MLRYLFILIAVAVAAWGFTLDASAWGQGFLFWRHQGILFTGLLAIILMGLLLVMATRPRWLEQRLGGLDHLYHLHKWSGISAGISVLMHWALTKSPRLLVDLGLLSLGPRAPRPPHAIDPLMGIAKEAGEMAFYAMIIFIIISLVRVLPYGRFRQIHKIGAVLFLVAAFHSVYLTPVSLLMSPFGILVLASALAGSIASIWTLLGQTGRTRRIEGSISGFQRHPGNVLELEITIAQGLKQYQPGQFAQLTLHKEEGAHPYTIVYHNTEKGIIRFAIKCLGDYTNTLPDRLKLGDKVSLEGPYGRFVLPQAGQKEYWIAGGIGITPFVAWLEILAMRGEKRDQSHLYYCVNRAEEAVFAQRIQELCRQTGVKLTILDQQIHGRLDISRLNVDQRTHVWFCGPGGMRKMLQNLLKIPSSQLHFEKFEFR